MTATAPSSFPSRENNFEISNNSNNNSNNASPIIGASLLPFLHPNATNDNGNDNEIGNGNGNGNGNDAITKSRTTEGFFGNGNINNKTSSSISNDNDNDNTSKKRVPDCALNEDLVNNGRRLRQRQQKQKCNRRHLSLLLDGSCISTTSCVGATISCYENEYLQQRKRRQKRKRLLLRGPSQSGKSSLAMNFAYSEASSECNTNNIYCKINNGNKNSDNANASANANANHQYEHQCSCLVCGGLPCSCVAVIVYRLDHSSQDDDDTDAHAHAHNNDTDNNDHKSNNENKDENDDRFPIFCRPIIASLIDNKSKNGNSNDSDDRMMNEEEKREVEDKQELQNHNNNNNAIDENKNGKNLSWDPFILNRIRVRRIMSIRDLWEDLFMLCGKPEHEQPTRSIVIEDLDKIIDMSMSMSYRNKNNNKNHYNDHSNSIIATMMKTVAIAADTAFAIDNNNQKLLLSSSCLSLLVTLTSEQQQQNRDVMIPMPMSTNLRSNIRSNNTMANGASDVLIAASCIDTVVTLRSSGVVDKVATAVRGNGNSSSSKNSNNDDNGSLSTWKKISLRGIKNSANSKLKESSSSSSSSNNDDVDNEETILLHSLWQAEIQEQYHYDNDDGDKINSSNRVSLVDYAFVEKLSSSSSYPNESHIYNDIDYYECEKELRWKYHT